MEEFIQNGRHPEISEIVEEEILKRIMDKLYRIHQIDLHFDPEEHEVLAQ
jgi:hypothetical protein